MADAHATLNFVSPPAFQRLSGAHFRLLLLGNDLPWHSHVARVISAAAVGVRALHDLRLAYVSGHRHPRRPAAARARVARCLPQRHARAGDREWLPGLRRVVGSERPRVPHPDHFAVLDGRRRGAAAGRRAAAPARHSRHAGGTVRRCALRSRRTGARIPSMRAC